MENSDTQLIGAVPVDPGGAELGRLAGGREPQKHLSMAHPSIFLLPRPSDCYCF